MKNSIALALKSVVVVSAVLLPVGVGVAALDKFQPYAFARVLKDSNIFRLSGDQEARALLDSTNRNDTVGHLGAGFRSVILSPFSQRYDFPCPFAEGGAMT